MTKKAEKSIRKTIYRHPVGALRVFCSVMLLALLGVCGYAGSAGGVTGPSGRVRVGRKTCHGPSVSL